MGNKFLAVAVRKVVNQPALLSNSCNVDPLYNNNSNSDKIIDPLLQRSDFSKPSEWSQGTNQMGWSDYNMKLRTKFKQDQTEAKLMNIKEMTDELGVDVYAFQ